MMKTIVRGTKALYALIGVSLAVAACSSGSATGAGGGTSSGSHSPLYIVGPLDLTGDFSHFGQLGLAGLKAEIAVVNQEGGVLGHPLELKYVDDGSDPAKAVLAAKQLLGDTPKDQILFFEPGSVGVTTTATLPITTAQKVLDFTLTSIPATDNATTYPYNFATFPTSAQQSASVVQAMKLLAGARVKVGVILGTDAGDQVAKPIIGGQLSGVGLQMASLISVDPEQTDYTPTLQRMRNAGVSVIYVKVDVTSAYNNVMSGVQQLGWKNVAILGGTPAANATVLGSIPSAVASQFYATSLKTYARQATSPELSTFRSALLKSAGSIEDLGLSSVYADQVRLAAWAANKAGSVDTDKMIAAIESLSTTSLPPDTLITLPSPRYSATVHNYAQTQVGKMWSLIKPGEPVGGQWNGQIFS